ncbi:extracellular solute-binding protein [Candidatus Bipolaricaulota sp. J31]
MDAWEFVRQPERPLYKQLKEYIRTWIESNRLQPGDKIPTERELSQLLGVSRLTVRQAIAELVEEGILYRVQGSGTYVAEAEASVLHALVPEREWIRYLLQGESRYNERNERHPVRLEIEVVGRPRLRDRIISAVAAGEAPDIVLIDLVWMAELAALQFFLPLDELDPAWTTTYLEDLLPGVKEGLLVNGHIFGVQADLSVTVLWYRKDLLEAEELEPPRTWDELVEHAAILVGKREVYGLGPFPIVFCGGVRGGETTTYQLLPLFWSAGVDLVKGRGSGLVGKRAERPLRFLYGLVHKHRLAPPEVVSLPWDGPRKALARGEAAFAFGGTYEKRAIQAAARLGEREFRERFGMVPIPAPRGGPPAAATGGMVFAVTRQTRDREASLGIMKELAAPDLMEAFCARTGRLPSRRSVAAVLEERSWYQREESAILPYARPRPTDPHYAKISYQFRSMVEDVLAGRASPQEAIARARAGIEAILHG